jgi:hypothetical protein
MRSPNARSEGSRMEREVYADPEEGIRACQVKVVGAAERDL